MTTRTRDYFKLSVLCAIWVCVALDKETRIIASVASVVWAAIGIISLFTDTEE